jgi:NADH:ubiquinone oxidoreductase subunit 6 (subunit J)
MNALFFWLFSGGMIIFALAVVLNRNAVASALCFTFTIVFMAGLFVMLSAFFLAAVQILVTAGAVMVLFLFIIMLLDLTAMEHMPRQKIWMGCTLVLALGFLGLVAKTLHGTPEGFLTIDSLPTPGQAPATPFITAESARHIHSSDLMSGREMPISPIKLPPPGSEKAMMPGNPHRFLARSTEAKPVAPDSAQSEIDQQDDTHRIGRLLFKTHVGPYEPSYVAPFEITSLLILVATIGVIVLCKQEERPRSGPREEITREAPPIEPSKDPALKS